MADIRFLEIDESMVTIQDFIFVPNGSIDCNIGIQFDIEKKFGKLPENADFYMFANYNPLKDKPSFRYIVWDPTAGHSNSVYLPTEKEEQVFMKLMNDYCQNHYDKPIKETAMEHYNKCRPLIEDLDLSVYTFKQLNRAGIKTIQELADMTLADIQKVENIGIKQIDEIKVKMQERGLVFPCIEKLSSLNSMIKNAENRSATQASSLKSTKETVKYFVEK